MVRWLVREHIGMKLFRGITLAGFLIATLLATSSQAGSLQLQGVAGRFSVPVKSLNEKRWDAVVRQKYDFSCGSAAVATLLTYHYDRPIAEDSVFKAMFTIGDRQRIQQHGFSLLDMKTYLDSLGLQSDGFRFTLEQFTRIGVPGITLINTKGYKHFVVVKGIEDDNVLIGDPAAGTTVVSRERFEKLWNGAVLAARADVETARKYFNAQRDWAVRPKSPVGHGVDRSGVGMSTLSLPGRNEIGR